MVCDDKGSKMQPSRYMGVKIPKSRKNLQSQVVTSFGRKISYLDHQLLLSSLSNMMDTTSYINGKVKKLKWHFLTCFCHFEH